MLKKLHFPLLFCIGLLPVRAEKHENCPWNVQELLSGIPSYKEIPDDIDHIKALIFESTTYKGFRKEVFAYYCTPGILKGDPSLDKNLPAVVCVHGGGGKAYQQWAKLWAEKGYAAIAMDLYGKSHVNGIQLEKGYRLGFRHNGVNICPDAEEDWIYQAVIDVIKAHSLIRSFKEVDPSRTAVTGMSWGGVLTTLVAGLDNRFRAAIPVYGCGYLYQKGTMARLIREEKENCLTYERWKNLYDPSLYASAIKCPILFINGTNDPFFFNDQWQETADLTRHPSYSVRYQMPHGPRNGWLPEEIYVFADRYLKNGSKGLIPEIKVTSQNGNDIQARILHLPPNAEVCLYYSRDKAINMDSPWEIQQLKTQDGRIAFTLPSGCTRWTLTVRSGDNTNFSTRIYFR